MPARTAARPISAPSPSTNWSWRKGFAYGTIIVDLERGNVVDVLQVRSATETARWLKRHLEIEIVSRERCGLSAEGVRQGAPQARQVADRFHMLQNVRDCIKRQMTDSPSFAVMRRLAMRFRGILRGDDPGKLGRWLNDARRSGIRSMQQFARTLSRDLDAVRNAVTEPRNSGQAEGQINRLKTFKRAMYGRASVGLLRARILALKPMSLHGE